MKGIKNFKVSLMDGSTHSVTSEDAVKIINAWNNQQKAIVIGTKAFACHQILGVDKDRQVESDEVANYLGMNIYDKDKISKFISKNQQSLELGGGNKQLT